MDLSSLKKLYGDEYPGAVICNGIRLPLTKERRFSRSYDLKERKLGAIVSRFMDGSACITATELQAEWHRWSEDDRLDFCQSCPWLQDQTDFADMLRFVMQHATPREWSAVALEVATRLPVEEAFDILVRTLRSVEIGRASNIAQAIAITKHPLAEATLRQHLNNVWQHEKLWDNDTFLNWVAYDATTCIAHLIELGAPSSDFAEKVRQLAKHPCAKNQDSCRSRLTKHYDGLA